MFKSPLRYPGGKSRVANIISDLIPEFDEYREPFLGGGSVFMRQNQLFPNKKFWINDSYFDLFNFWKESQKDDFGLIKKVQEFKGKYKNGKDLYKFLKFNQDNFSKQEKAAAFFVFNRITFSGTTLSGGYSESAFQERFTESSIERLKPFEEILKDVKITNFDYKKLINSNGKNVFLYLDPPYFSAQKSKLYGKKGNHHINFNYEDFAEVLKTCKHKWLITLDNNEYIRELFSFATIKPFEFAYGMRNVKANSNQVGKELFISNYR